MKPIEDYLPQSHIDIQQHIESKRVELGASLESKRAVYLDTKFWILLRDTSLSRSLDDTTRLLELLRTGRREELLFCPIEENVLVEILKQSDASSRNATADLIDELSGGVALMPGDSRVETELAHLVHKYSGNPKPQPIQRYMWTRLTYVLGTTIPNLSSINPSIDPSFELAMQKSFFDYAWSMPLAKLLREQPHPLAHDLEGVAAKINQGNALHAGELRNFAQTYSAEVRGLVDLVAESANDIVFSVARQQGVDLAKPTEEERRTAINQFKNLFAIVLEKAKARNDLRTVHILASLFASVRWNKGQKMEGNHIYDFQHAAAALGYCDVFLTERSLATMVSQKHLALETINGCEVHWQPKAAVNCIRRLVEEAR
ncbi:hypothetical protein [Rhizobium laguerreae]|uniref:hypothetical protein n=1 Tax=Rhizobium laguerreae TaxID=1076926 RepID=UPI001C910FD0|nr:hypothetical protein [Rhizobium laguerreae]MBY3386305.1 hypothetical protein [Rhizobium laguerreae]MBY3400388.1 hypothetical protein [Rhizobium laguerreae]MBY3407325.1 hypothetical protein [Rhizobium laguerreae]